MADTKITALTAITTVDPAVDVLPIVDVSDTTMAASGTTKKITSNQILGAGGTATLASATITGALTVGTGANAAVQKGSILGGYTVFENSAGTGNPSITFNNDIDTGLLNPTANTIAFAIGGSESMRLNSTGLGVGKTPAYKLDVLRSGDGITAGFAGGTYGIRFDCGGGFSSTGSTIFGVDPTLTGTYQPLGISGSLLTFGISGVEKARLDASGNLSVGATTPLNSVRIFAERSGGSVAGFNRTSSDGTNVLFYRSGSIVGDVSVTTTGTTFNSTSDYRLKESVAPMSGGLARVNALKPSVYKWKSNGSDGEGFLAHELAEVVPAAVNGEKDAVNEDGTIKAQSIDMSRIVPILVAAIKELTAEVNALKNA